MGLIEWNKLQRPQAPVQSPQPKPSFLQKVGGFVSNLVPTLSQDLPQAFRTSRSARDVGNLAFQQNQQLQQARNSGMKGVALRDFIKKQNSVSEPALANLNQQASQLKNPWQLIGNAVTTGLTLSPVAGMALGKAGFGAAAPTATRTTANLLRTPLSRAATTKAWAGLMGAQGGFSGYGNGDRGLKLAGDVIGNAALAAIPHGTSKYIPNVGKTPIVGAIPRYATNVAAGYGAARLAGQDPTSAAVSGFLTGLGTSGKQSVAHTLSPYEVKAVSAKELVSHEGAPDKARVQYYKEKIQKTNSVEPLKVVRNGDNLEVLDGQHRLQAIKELGIQNAPVQLVGEARASGFGSNFANTGNKKYNVFHYQEQPVKVKMNGAEVALDAEGNIIPINNYQTKQQPLTQKQIKTLRDDLGRFQGRESKTVTVGSNFGNTGQDTGVPLSQKDAKGLFQSNSANQEQVMNTLMELDAAQPGKRVVGTNPDTGEKFNLPSPSTYPKWIPEALRSRPLIDKVLGTFDENMNVTQRLTGKAGELQKVVHEHLDIPLPETAPPVKRTQLTGKALSTPSSDLTPQNPNIYMPPAGTANTFEGKPPVTLEQIKAPTIEASRPQVKSASVPEIPSEQVAANAQSAQYSADTNQGGFRQAFNTWIGKRNAAETVGVQVGKQFTSIPKTERVSVIRALEGYDNVPLSETSSQAVKAIRGEYDRLYKEAKTAGVDIGYLKDYITHIWDKDPAEVAQLYKSARGKFQFSKERTLPTYDEGIQLGLKPKYDNPAQIIGEYTRRLEQAKANISLINDLKTNGVLVDASVGMRTPGFKPVLATGVPPSVSRIGEETVKVGSYWAPAEIADQINKVFSPEVPGTLGKFLKGTASASSLIQDITLSGGIPGTAANAFTFAQMTKEVMAGRVISPLTSIFKSMSGGSTRAFFEENADQLIKMQERGISLNTNLSIEDLVPHGLANRNFGQKVAGVWNKVVNEPTFKRFMPMMQVNLFNDIEAAALRGGRTASEAADVAAKAVKNFYGLTEAGDVARRSAIGQNLTSTVFFAPRYRESMVNFWVNNIKAMRNPLALENRQNTIFAVSAIATFFAMDKLNQQYNNGKHLWDNPKGKEDKLLIPMNDGYTLGIPFLSSIATVPRTVYKIGKNLVQGDTKQAFLESKSLLSQSIRPGFDILQNENYYGRPIYKETDTSQEKFKKQANYLFNPITGAYGHPYIRAGAQAIKGEQPNYQIASQAVEAPLRFYDTGSLKASEVYDQRNKLDQEKSARNKKIEEQINNGDMSGLQGMSSQQRSALIRTAKENQIKSTLTGVDKAIWGTSKEEKAQLLSQNSDLAPNIQKIMQLEAALKTGDAPSQKEQKLALFQAMLSNPSTTPEQKKAIQDAAYYTAIGKTVPKVKVRRGRKVRIAKVKIRKVRIPKPRAIRIRTAGSIRIKKA